MRRKRPRPENLANIVYWAIRQSVFSYCMMLGIGMIAYRRLLIWRDSFLVSNPGLDVVGGVAGGDLGAMDWLDEASITIW